MSIRLRNLFTLNILLDVRTIGLLLVLIAFGSAIFGYVRVHGEFDLLTVVADFYANISSELGGIAITVLIVDGLSRRRDEQNRLRNLQTELVRQAGSPIHSTAISGVDALRQRGWLGRKNMTSVPDDSLSLLAGAKLISADLNNANLDRVDMNKADLESANLTDATLEEANLTLAYMYNVTLTRAKLHLAMLNGANLERANLTRANARYSKLNGANLEGAIIKEVDLRYADLVNANLRAADLSGTDLVHANLTGAIIDKHTRFDPETTLPDGKKWTDKRDLADFGAETREIKNVHTTADVDNNLTIVYTFKDDTTRRWQRGTGWLD